MKCSKFAAVLIGVISIGCLGQEASSKATAQYSSEKPKAVTKESSVQTILQILAKANVSGSLEFSGNCDYIAFGAFPEFPQVHAPATIRGTPLQALRRIFADDPAMRITRDAGGTIRMVERGVPTDILNVKIHHLSFAPPAYNTSAAVNYIASTPEVELFGKSHSIDWPHGGRAVDIIVTETPAGPIAAVEMHPPAELRISGSIDNVSVSEAMDHILKTFPGLWTYESCPPTIRQQRTVHFEFYGYDQIH